MAKVLILESLKNEVLKKLKGEAVEAFELMLSLKNSPQKGKLLGNVGNLVTKEIKYKSFRFYFITDGHILKIMDESNLIDLLITFVRMSDKKSQQKTINEIKNVLKHFGPEGFKK